MDFLWAVKLMRAGKKVVREAWNTPKHINYVYLDDGVYTTSDNSRREFCLIDFDAVDWKLFEEPKPTLSDNIQTIHSTDSNDKCVINFNEWCKVEDIKEFIKNIRDEHRKQRDNDPYFDGVNAVLKSIEKFAGPLFKE
jgi:hypothetical protein